MSKIIVTATWLVFACLSGGVSRIYAEPAPEQLPEGAQIAAGDIGVQQQGAHLAIQQHSSQGIINWQSFDVGEAASVEFKQPDQQAVTLNRVLNSQPSEILGKLTANGQVFLVNPNGIYFGKSANVEVAGLVASTHSLSDEDFKAGQFQFQRNDSQGAIINEGNIRAALGGYIALLAPEVRNEGVIVAQMGSIVLASGESIKLQFQNNQHLSAIEVEPSHIKALIANKGAVLAPGGLIILSAKAADSLQGGVINNEGSLEATGMNKVAGRIVLEASDSVHNTGTIVADADAQGSAAGEITIQAPNVSNQGVITASAESKGELQTRQEASNLATSVSSLPSNSQQTHGSASHALHPGGAIKVNAEHLSQVAHGRISVQGTQGGSIVLAATQDINLAGEVNASSTVPSSRSSDTAFLGSGGKIELSSPQTILHALQLTAEGETHGGSITVTGNLPHAPVPRPEQPDVVLLPNTQVRVNSRRGIAGEISVTGTYLQIQNQALLESSGALGGGKVLLGGDWQGGGDLAQALRVDFAPGASIHANATELGNGGTVVLWSDLHYVSGFTSAQGSIQAMGGALGGQGGQIETSGHQTDISGLNINAGAPLGQGGLWLIDPFNYNLDSTAAASIVNSLNNGTSVSLDTANNTGIVAGASGAGDITVSANIITGAMSNDATLSLKASRYITLNSNISIDATQNSNTRKLHVDLQHTSLGNTTTGEIELKTGSSIKSNGGNITLRGDTTGYLGALYVAGANEPGVLMTQATLDATAAGGGGNIKLYGKVVASYDDGIQLIGSNIKTNGTGTIGLYGDGWAGNVVRDTGGVNFRSGNNLVTTTAGDIEIIGTLPNTNNNTNWAAGVEFNSAGLGQVEITSLTGNILVAGDKATGINSYGLSQYSFGDVFIGSPPGATGGSIHTGNVTLRYPSWSEPSFTYNFYVHTLGKLAIEPFNSSFENPFNWQGSGSTDFTGSSMFSNLNMIIKNMPSLTGFTLGKTGNSADITLSNPISINGPVNFWANGAGGNVNINANLTSTNGDILLDGTGTLTIASATAINTSNGNVTLTGNRFINNAGASALSAGGSGKRWQVWSSNANPFGGATPDTRGGLAFDYKQYNATYGISSVLGTGNGLLYTLAPALTPSLTGSVTKAYDAGTAITLTGSNLSATGLVDADITPTFSFSSSILANKNVATGKTVNVSGISFVSANSSVATGSKSVFGYSLASTTASGNIASVTAVPLSISGLTANNKVYNANTVASLSGTPSVTPLGSDVVSVTGTAVSSFATKDVANGKAVTVTGLSFSGADAANYTAVQPSGLTANITAAPLSITGLTANNKVYNANTLASLSGTPSITPLGSDVVNISGTAVGSFATKDVANGKAVTVTGLYFTGADAGNYTAVQPTGLTANITAAPLSILGLTANNKVYNANTVASLSGTPSITPLGSDVVSVTGTAVSSFATKDVANGKAVTVTGLSFSGADAGNYTVVQPTGLTANITAAPLSITGLTANNKVYNADTVATLTGTPSITPLGSDVVNITGTAVGSFSTKDVATGKAVTVTGLSFSGTDAANYTAVQPTGLTANITPASLSISGLTANNKVYNADTVATLTGTPSITPLGSDVVNISGTAVGSFATKDVANGKAVTVTGLSFTGADAGNYTAVQPSGLTANITQASLSISGLTANNKVYNADTVATLTGTPSITLLGSDVVNITGTAVGSFATKDVANGKAVTVTGLSFTGTDAGNYTAVAPTGLTANITAAPLSISGLTANNKVYNADTVATLTGTPSITPLGSDVVNISGTAVGSFATKDVANGKAVTVTGLSFAGADAGNYTAVQPSGLTANITTAPLSITGLSANNKVYNANTVASLSGTPSITPLGSDVVNITGTAVGSFATKDVANGKAVTVTGLSFTGTDAANYTAVQPSGLTANITAAPLSITGLTANNKVYNADTVATLTGTPSITPLGSDVVNISGTAVGSFATKDVANGKAVTVTGLSFSGTDAANYTAVQPTGLTANITAAPLSISGLTANNKVYNANTVASLSGTPSITPLGSDVVNISGTAVGSFATKDVANGKAVTVTGLSFTGADAGNYTVVQPTGLTANITAAPLSISGLTANNKVYNANTVASLSGTPSITPLGSDVVNISGTAVGNFATKDVANGKVVTVTGLSFSGADAGNYSAVQPTGLTANITAAPLSITGLTANNKVYNANTVASLSGTPSITPLGSDVVNISGTVVGSFATKDVANGKAVTVTGLSFTGADAGNYNAVAPTGLTANITAAPLSITGLTPNNKVYNANTVASLSGTPSITPLGSDVVNISGTAVGSFASKDVANGKVVTITGLSFTGTDAGNYSALQPQGNRA